MIRFSSLAPNLYINADGYLEDFLGTGIFGATSASKARVATYERDLSGLLGKIAAKYTGYFVLRELASAGQRVEIRPHEFAGDDKGSGDPNPTTVATRERDAYRKGTPYLDASDLKQEGKAAGVCSDYNAGVRDGFKQATGGGSPVLIGFNPRATFPASESGPGSDKDSLILHEIVHAIRNARGLRNGCKPAPPDYDSYEEFVAIVVTNVYDSELRRPPRRNHHGFDKLSDKMSASDAFYGKFKEHLAPIRNDHPNLCAALKKATALSFNPFAVMA